MTFRLTPSVLQTILQPWTDVVEPIYDRVAHMTDAWARGETLWIGCGSGRSALWWAQRFQSEVQGLDPDPKAIESAEHRVRGSKLTSLVTFQSADAANLPHEDDVFDTVVVHMLYLRDVGGAEVASEAVRVLRENGNIVLIAPTWLQTPTEKDSTSMSSLGLNPHVTMEWKAYLRDAGVSDLTVEEAAKDGNWFAPGLLTLLIRGWHAAGWAGARAMVTKEVRMLRRLVRKRVLGLTIVKGTYRPKE